MKNKNILIAILPLAAAVMAVSCKQKGTTAQQLDKAGEKTAEVARDMKNYAFAEKNAFVKNMQDQLAALNRDLDQLAARIARSSEQVKAEAQPKLDALREQSALLNKQLNVAEDATESTWDVVKSDLGKSYEATRQGFQQSRQWLADKIAP